MKQPRYGRQIPEWIVISVAFSLSAILGLPLAGRLRIAYPEANKLLLAAIGLVIGFALLAAIIAVWVLVFSLLAQVLEKKRGR